MKGAMSMYDYRGKIGGVIGSAIGLIGMVAERIHGFVFIRKFNVEQHYGMFEWIMLGGLFVVIFSREKNDDERVKMVRSKAMQIAFGIENCTILAVAFSSITAKEFTVPASILYFLAAIGLLLYLLFFHIGLYFDFLWEYDDKGVWENLKNLGKNKWGLLVYFAVSVVALLLLSLLEQ